jgi:phospholipid transport system substrate-binding protein
MRILATCSALAVLATGTLLLAASAETKPSGAAAKDLVIKATNEGIAILRDKSLTREQRNERLAKVAFQHMDFEIVSRLCMGRHWRTIPEDKRKEFMTEFRTRLVIAYTFNLDQYSGQEVVVTNTRQEPDGDWTVSSSIVDTDKKELAKVEYRLRPKNNELRLIDVTIEGVSLIANYRSQFQEIMSNGGIEKVLQIIREKNARGEK